jgi:hypothetical protein
MCFQPFGQEPGPPLTHRRRRTSQLGRHHLVASAFSAGQHDLRSQRQTLRARRAPSPTGQCVSLFVIEYQNSFRWTGSSHAHLHHRMTEGAATDRNSFPQ